MKRRLPHFLFFSLALFSVLGLGMSSPVPQDSSYHDYADQRVLFGIPYFWNVVSNIPMFFIGLYGLRRVVQRWQQYPPGVAGWIPLVLYTGIFTTSFGSAYYHWAPDNATLLWDRLPMTLMFMSLFSILLYDYLGKQSGTIGFLLALPLGVLSVLYWYFMEAAGYGDLRPYAFVQFFPMVAAPALMLLFPGKAPYVKYVLLVLGWYILAKICEHADHQVYALTGFWSGHTFKHFLGAIGLLYVVRVVNLSPACGAVILTENKVERA